MSLQDVAARNRFDLPHNWVHFWELIETDLGMLFIPKLNVLCKIFRDRKGLYVRLPHDRKNKAYLEAAA